MNVAVWDTYARSRSGSTLHFDIIVPETETDATRIYDFVRTYLASLGEPFDGINSEHCQRCHIESPTLEVLASIAEKGYYILDLGVIPANLPENPSRRDMILHLRATDPAYRFADFRDMDDSALRRMTGLM